MTTVLVTTAVNGDHAGSVSRFHTQCSADPIHYAVWVAVRSRTYAISLQATHIAVHVLDDGADPFEELPTTTGDVPAAVFDRCEWRPGPGGLPLLASCPSPLVLELVSSRVDRGGYACLLGVLVDPDRGASVQALPDGQRTTRADGRLESSGDRRTGGQAIGPMDAETRRRLINAAIGAGHTIDLLTNG